MFLRYMLPLILAVLYTSTPAHAEDVVQATGRVYTADAKQPLAHALVAIYDDKNNVIAHAKTDADGRYVVSVPRSALHLPGVRKGNGFFKQLGRGIKAVAGVALSTVSAVAPLALGGTEALAVLGGLDGLRSLAGPKSNGNAVAQTLHENSGLVAKLMAGTLTRDEEEDLINDGVPPQVIEKLRNASRGQATGVTDNAPDPNAPGALHMRVSLPGYRDLQSVGQIYWAQEETLSANGKTTKRLAAWLDPIHLAPISVAGAAVLLDAASSRVSRSYFRFEEARVEPSIVERGQTATVSVRLQTPPEPDNLPFLVVGRIINGRGERSVLFELKPTSEPGTYRGAFVIDRSFAKNDQTICILAYPVPRSGSPGQRSKSAEEALDRAGVWRLDQPFDWNPLVVASRNRAELRLTVVEPVAATRPARSDASTSNL